MNLPINTTEDGTAFAVKAVLRACFSTLTNGGGHFPETGVCVVYQLPFAGDMRDGSLPQPQGRVAELPRRVGGAVERGDGDLGGVRDDD